MNVSNALKKEDYYTYADYAGWELEKHERYELIDGVPYLMAAPSVLHQRVSGRLSFALFDFLEHKPCQVFFAPFDVCLYGEGDDDDSVVQPDIIVVCDESKLDDKRCNGAPDIAVEIISPSSDKFDRVKKFRKYEHAGVREYWIVDPAGYSAEINVLENGKYKTAKYGGNDVIKSSVLNGFEIGVSDIFEEKRERI